MINWLIENLIKKGEISFELNEEVVLFKRKKNGYPNNISDDLVYIVDEIEGDYLFIYEKGSKNMYKIHKTYMINKETLRDIKINHILK